MARYLDCGCWTGLMTRPPLAFKDFHLSILTSLDSVETGPGGGARWIGNVKDTAERNKTEIERAHLFVCLFVSFTSRIAEVVLLK